MKLRNFILLLITAFLFACENNDVEQKQNPNIVSNSNLLKDHIAFIEQLRKPAIVFQDKKNKSISKIGGLPLVNDNFEWPQWQGHPMTFLLQINLEDLPSENNFNTLPRKGLLSFYYDSQQSTWGFDPKDKGSWKIIYSETIDNLKIAKTPENHIPFKEFYIGFKSELSYPDVQDDNIYSLDLDDEQTDAYYELRDEIYNNQPRHQLFGHVTAVQNPEMHIKSQLASNGIYLGDSSGYNSEKAKSLMAGSSEWRLLLQFDTDEELGIMWSDSGTLYFWMRQEDIKNKNFDKAWMILQSY